MPDVQQAVLTPISEDPQGSVVYAPTVSERTAGVLLWVPGAGRQQTIRQPHPFAVLPEDWRIDHVRRRLFERLDIDIGRERILAIEAKIRRCETYREQLKSYPSVLPQYVGWKKTKLLRRQYWSASINGKKAIFVVDRPTMLIISVVRKNYGQTRPKPTA